MISSKLHSRKSSNTRLFDDVTLSCSRELEKLGFSADVFLTTGGVGVRFLNDSNLQNLDSLAHLPIKDLDFSKVTELDPESIRGFQLKGLSLPWGCSIPLRSFKFFNLNRFSAKNCKATDYESLAILPIEELNLSGSSVEQLSFIHSMPLTKLNLSQTSVLDIRPMGDRPIEKLNLQGTQVDNLTAINSCPLSEINLNQTHVENLEPLRKCPLIEIQLRKTLVEDLNPLIETPLERLFLPGSPVRNLNPLTFCPLKYLNIIGLKIDDFSPLFEMDLETLCISPLELSEEQLSELSHLNIKHIVGPGDSPEQSATEFFEKYSGPMNI